ncbi:hypothetical protein BELL_0086g00270 [Botrytis elliptica]|uniref:Helicase ATP-binding domain-containing protein n=1 Tax=Botrytis elliptica TaxID=278938 RepID=A0A4Z1JVL0_9HELO|nr:hypothetical protein EAE99_007725 [Botrytis elliptica]TGO77921.1 hypothetical protein BELL_0086g00270 [Botrytis elliptica]
MRPEKEIKDLLRHIARSLEQIPEPIENQGNTENTESVGRKTVGTSIATALAPIKHQLWRKHVDNSTFETVKYHGRGELGPNTTLKFWQPSGVSWIVNKSAEIGGCILGDYMGLGKTLQALGLIFHLKMRGRRAMICGKLLSEKYQVHLYCAREKIPILNKESLKSLEHPECHNFVANFEWLKAKHKGQNKTDLGEVFDTVIIDEAHIIKDESTGNYEVLSELAPLNFILLTGTPVMNQDIDIAAMLSLFRPDSLWEDMQCDRKTNSFHLEDNHRHAVLRATSFADHRYPNTLPKKDHVKGGEWLGKIYDISPP